MPDDAPHTHDHTPELNMRPRHRHIGAAGHLDPGLPPRLQELLKHGKAAAVAPFTGLTTDGAARPGLFPLHRTGISLAPVVSAAESFLATLTPSERDTASFAVESDAWREWSNIHPYLMRHGVSLRDLTDAQRGAALALVRESLSATGFTTARNVMKLNDHIRELTGRPEEYGEWYYWLSIFGTPSEQQPWGWQIDGHHLIINCFVLGDQIVLTPQFLGSEPVVATSGQHAGTRVFEAEEAKGFALMHALSPEQQVQATIGKDLPMEVFAAAYRDNLTLNYQGIRYDRLTPDQQSLLLDLINVYVGRIRPGHAEIRLDEVEAHLHETWFAWMGNCDAASPFYYRIHSPAILIEFDHQRGIALDNDEPSRNHIHTLVRTPNGNDYGKDLLRQHYEQHDHSHPHTPHRQGLE
ncbi:MAG TPA: DUF3500 domain-containing protein [Acetobacteraceae bacterium]|jgi:hypothetical protein|nr:DUF3500 domain-containing protein [Acetobacteraceae bacterium]